MKGIISSILAKCQKKGHLDHMPEFFIIRDGERLLPNSLSTSEINALNSMPASWWRSVPDAKIVQLNLIEKVKS